MLYKFLYVCLLMCCVIACTTDSTDEGDVDSIFPVPPVISEDEKGTTTPEIQIAVVNPPIPEPIVEPVEEPEEIPEPIKEEPEPIEEEVPKDETPPRLVKTTIKHGDIGVDIDTDSFVFTFDEDIDGIRIKLREFKRFFDMKWTHFIRGKEVVFLQFDEGFPLQAETVYEIRFSVVDKARNWSPDWGITFITEVKE